MDKLKQIRDRQKGIGDLEDKAENISLPESGRERQRNGEGKMKWGKKILNETKSQKGGKKKQSVK